MNTDEIKKVLDKFYYDPKYGVVGPEKLYHRLKDLGITLKQIKNYLKAQEVHQVNERPDYNGSFVPMYPLHEFQIDLIHLENRYLNNASYGLCCIDVFSKKADIELMKTKDKSESVRAMKVLIEKMGVPEMIYCDEGTEFTSGAFRTLMKEYGIDLVFTIRHAPVVERFNRTIKNMLSKYLQITRSKTISKVLPILIDNYNNSYHKTIRMTPNEVNDSNVHEVWHNIYSRAKIRKREEIKAGDKVRALLKEKAFAKKYKPLWSKQTYTITQRRGKYYYLDNLDRKYLRAHIKKIGEVQTRDVEPLLDNTREGRLKEIAKMRKTRSMVEKESLEKERPKREKRKPDFYK